MRAGGAFRSQLACARTLQRFPRLRNELDMFYATGGRPLRHETWAAAAARKTSRASATTTWSNIVCIQSQSSNLSLGPSLDPQLPLAALTLLPHPLSTFFCAWGPERVGSLGAVKVTPK